MNCRLAAVSLIAKRSTPRKRSGIPLVVPDVRRCPQMSGFLRILARRD
jgi:hypothetical protein